MSALELADEAATRALGARIAGSFAAGGVIYLQGELGAGKTTLVRGLLGALGVGGRVKSPTYTLLEPYELAGGRLAVHLDLYRLGAAEELEYLGLRELAQPGNLLLVEWPERGAGHLPPPDLRVILSHHGEARRARLEPPGTLA